MLIQRENNPRNEWSEEDLSVYLELRSRLEGHFEEEISIDRADGLSLRLKTEGATVVLDLDLNDDGYQASLWLTQGDAKRQKFDYFASALGLEIEKSKEDKS